jgi:hypothetical protein
MARLIFQDLYVIVNEKTCTITDLWDGQNLKCTFRRTVDEKLGRAWLELVQIARLGRAWLQVVQIASTIRFSADEDALVWKFTSDGVHMSGVKGLMGREAR